jgi:hypothetical protein
VWSGELLAAATADNSWLATFAPRRGHLLVVDRPTGMPVLKTGMMEVAYTKYYGGQSGMPGTDSDAFDIIFTATTSKNGQLLVGEFVGSGCGASVGPRAQLGSQGWDYLLRVKLGGGERERERGSMLLLSGLECEQTENGRGVCLHLFAGAWGTG